jgi:hypothetical protein
VKPISASLLALSVLALLGCGHIANAQVTFYPNDATINTAVLGEVYIGQDDQRNPSSPTVNLVDPGSISGFAYTFNSSKFNISGGSIVGSINSSDTSLVTITGGSIGNGLQVDDSSVVNVRGGSFGADLYANDTSAINFFGTNLQAMQIADLGTIIGYALSGTLADGTDISDRQLFVQNTASFTLNNTPGPAVPEPGSFALLCGLGVMGAGLLRRKRSR